MTRAQFAALFLLACAPLLTRAQSQDDPFVSYRVVLENQVTHQRAMDAQGMEEFGYPWTFSGQVGCDTSFPCAPGVSRVSWQGQGLTLAPPQSSQNPEDFLVRIQVILTEHGPDGNRVRNATWEGPLDTAYEERLLGKWFVLRAASRLEP